MLPFATAWRELKGIMQSEISQIEKDKYHMISLTCGKFKNNKQINKQKNLIDTENRLVVVRGMGSGVGEMS